jgi:uncharacterized membrane protein (DUF485 family)
MNAPGISMKFRGGVHQNNHWRAGMDHETSSNRILKSPQYAELVRKRTRFAFVLSALMLVIYYGFILVIAFAPTIFGAPLTAGSVTTVGFPIGVGVILSAIVLTGIYVWRANTEFDDLTRRLIEGSK